MIWVGERTGVEISVAQSPEELDKAWDQIGGEYVPPPEQRAPWLDMLGKETHSYLVARLGEMAVGWEMVKFDGAVKREKKVNEALRARYPEQFPVPIIYALTVSPDHQFLGVARDLVDTAELHILDTPGAPQRSALSVRLKNVPALHIFETQGYKPIPHKGRLAVVLDIPAQSMVAPDEKPLKSYIMSKDLSGTVDVE
jgi:ribosomal protein S18 acetylase RimI-like enzyme